MSKQLRLRGIAGAALVLVILLGLIVQPVLSQTYRFSIPQSSADVYVNEDGTVSIEYVYVFQNDPSADPIDVVDIGMPTNYYDINSITASIDGQPLTRIEESPYVKPGVAIDLGSYDIPPGQTGELRVSIGRIERMLFRAQAQDQDQEAYGSFQFQPNYFGSEFVQGRTDMTITLHLPPGLQENEPRYFPPKNWPGADEPEAGFDEQDRVYYRWQSPEASSDAQYTFGASFPARLVAEGALLVPVSSTDGGSILSTEWICPVVFCLGFVGFMVFSIVTAVNNEKKRRLQYLPPKVAVEGNGIKRGLAAPEAAILMQKPMDKILTMILFSVVKKGAARVASQNPMKVEVIPNVQADLRPYESEFLQAMAFQRPAEQRRGLQDMMTNLVRGVSEKMRGFSRKETVDYYQDIMNKAWQQVEQANTPELKMKMFDDAMDWTMLDRDFDGHAKEVFGPRPVILPGWWGNYDPTYRPTGGGMGQQSSIPRPSVSTAGNRPPEGMSMPSLPGSDFAASVVGGMQNFASNVVGDLTSFTGGVTAKTNPPPKPAPSSSRRGGGGGGRSCACACACAGCACACAGGGR